MTLSLNEVIRAIRSFRARHGVHPDRIEVSQEQYDRLVKDFSALPYTVLDLRKGGMRLDNVPVEIVP